MSEDQQGMIKLCGLWRQEGRGEEGKVYYSGSLTYGTNILMFQNSFKTKDNKQPDLILYIARKEKKEDKPKATETGDEVPF